MFPDNKYLSFSNGIKWLKFYYQNIDHTALILPGEVPFKFIGNNMEYMLSTWPNNTESLVAKIVQEQHFGNGMSITKFSSIMSERWTFFSAANVIRVDLMLVQNIDLLLKFLFYLQ